MPVPYRNRVCLSVRQHFDSVRNSFQRCRILRGRYLYILGPKGESSRTSTELCKLFGSDTTASGFQHTPCIRRCRRARQIAILFGSKDQGHTELVNRLVLTWYFNIQLSNSYIDAGFWEEEGSGQGHQLKFTSFGSDMITWACFNIQLSYFIHRCRMARGRYLYMYILGSKSQSPTELCYNAFVLHSTYSFDILYMDAWCEEVWDQKVTGQRHKLDCQITWACFNIQLSYFIHRCRMARGRYLYSKTCNWRTLKGLKKSVLYRQVSV